MMCILSSSLFDAGLGAFVGWVHRFNATNRIG